MLFLSYYYYILSTIICVIIYIYICILFERLNDAAQKVGLTYAGPGMRREVGTVRMVSERNSLERRPLGRPKLRWEDTVKRDVETN